MIGHSNGFQLVVSWLKGLMRSGKEVIQMKQKYRG